MSQAENRYNSRGVSASKVDVHAAIKNIDKGLFPKAFCKIVPDYLTGSEEHCIVMHADGAGTKSSLAYIYWKETGDLSVPLHLRNAPTKLMKDLAYGENYQYAHSFEGNFVDQDFLPIEIKDSILYEPNNNPRENEVLLWLKKWWPKKYF